MKLTQELLDKIQEAMLHTNLKGEINWKDGDNIEVQIAGTFAKDKFIVLKNASKNPFENAQPHPHFAYEKKVFTEDGTFVNSVSNRMVTFDCSIKHAPVSCTDRDRRIVVNINYSKLEK